MAVQKSKVSRSKTGMRRANDSMKSGEMSTDPTTGLEHKYHHIAGEYYRGEKVYRNFNAIEKEKQIESQSSQADEVDG